MSADHCRGLNTHKYQIVLRILEILGIIAALSCVIYGNPACLNSDGTNCTNPDTIWPSMWFQYESLYGQFFVLAASTWIIIAFIILIIYYCILKLWSKTVCYVIIAFNALLMVDCCGLEAWYACGIKGGKMSPTLYVGSYIGAAILYFLMLVVLSIDALMTKRDLVFQWPPNYSKRVEVVMAASFIPISTEEKPHPFDIQYLRKLKY